MSHGARFTLSIPNAGTDTPALSTLMSKGAARSTFGNAARLTVHAPAALTGVVTVQVSSKYGSGVWKTLQTETGVDIAIAAGKAVPLALYAGIEDIRIHSAGAEAAQRDFDVFFDINME